MKIKLLVSIIVIFIVLSSCGNNKEKSKINLEYSDPDVSIENNEESKKFASTIKDQQLREDILIKILNEEDLSVAGFDVSVEEGVVTLHGIVIQEVDRNSSEKIVRQIPGVKDVKNLIGVSKYTDL